MALPPDELKAWVALLKLLDESYQEIKAGNRED